MVQLKDSHLDLGELGIVGTELQSYTTHIGVVVDSLIDRSMMCKFNMFITAICVLFLIKLRWPKNKSIYVTTRCTRVAKRVQHVAPTNVAICCVQML